MSETTSTPGASESNPAAGEGSTDGAAGSVVPEGFVPVAELERERQRAREFQSRYDQLQAAQSQGGGSALAGGSSESDDGVGGFDPDAFRQSLLRDIYEANSTARTVESLKAEFPHADPALFSPDRVAGFRSPEALRFAVEDSHRRVTAIVAEERAALEAKIREELAAQSGGSAGPAGTPPVPGGDPTPEQLLAMDMDEWDRLEAASPGLIERVLSGSSQ